jgi:spoIIIJ-associated protein
MDRVAVEGENLEAALRTAREELGVQGDHEFGYEFDREHFRKGADTVRLFVWPKKIDSVGAVRYGMDFVNGFLERFGVEGAQISVEEADGKSILSLSVGEAGNILIGRDGKNLAALQHILTKALIHNEHDQKVMLDVEDYRARRDDMLREQAQSAIQAVRRDREIVELGPMNSYERRLIHIEVRTHDDVKSRSVGEGSLKTVEIGLVDGD